MTAAEPRYGVIGALAAMPRRLAGRAAEAAGTCLERGTKRRTTHAVFGRSLLARMSEAAIRARARAERDCGRELVSENGFLRRIGVLAAARHGDIPREALLANSRIEAEDIDFLILFDGFGSDREPFAFADVILARKYRGLLAGGASPAAIVRAIHRSGYAVSLTAKALAVGTGQTIYASHQGRLSELDGQLLLGIAEPQEDPDEVFAAAEAAEAEGRHDEAAALYGRCLSMDPVDTVAAFNRANCLREAGRANEAEAEYARALRADPGFAEAWFNLAALVKERGRSAAARRHLERALDADPDYADAVFNLAALAFETQDLVSARRWWTRYIELDSDSDWARTAERGLQFLASRQASAG